MYPISFLEEAYRKFRDDLTEALPEGIMIIDMDLLKELNLLNTLYETPEDPPLTHHFHAVEMPDKLTLVNDQFVIWITPEQVDGENITLTLIAFNRSEGPHLEMAFAATGVYNSSKVILRVLEKFLEEIKENEEIFKNLG